MLIARAFLLVLVLVAPASAQSIAYSLQMGSSMFREFCLPPCACPPFTQTGPVQGSFVLSPLDSTPLYDRYSVSDISWVADFNGQTTTMTGSGIYSIGGEFALMHRLELDLTIGSLTVIVPFDSGYVPVAPQHHFPRLSIQSTTGQIGCNRDTLTIIAAPGTTCYANCDESTAAPVLNVADFTCFLQRFAEGSQLPVSEQWNHYANCDHNNSQPPVLNIADFTCFLQRFALGCS